MTSVTWYWQQPYHHAASPLLKCQGVFAAGLERCALSFYRFVPAVSLANLPLLRPVPQVLDENNKNRKSLVDQVVGMALPESRNPEQVRGKVASEGEGGCATSAV